MIPDSIQKQREAVVEKIIESLEKGEIPWRKGWAHFEMPRNAGTGRPYTGMNAFNLLISAVDKGRAHDPRYLTYDQAKKLGCQVKKGETGQKIEFWQEYVNEYPKIKDGAPVLDKDGKEEVEKHTSWRPKIYTVFHASQIEGLEPYKTPEKKPEQIYEKAERILKESGATIEHESGLKLQASYHPVADKISLPTKDLFHTPEDYYGTALHELGHWTGHESRLNRKGITQENSRFGHPEYAREELVAEIAAAFVAIETGVASHNPEVEKNTIAYCRSWAEVLKKDPNEMYKAASQANKAAEFMLKHERVREKSQVKNLQTHRPESALELTKDYKAPLFAYDVLEGTKPGQVKKEYLLTSQINEKDYENCILLGTLASRVPLTPVIYPDGHTKIAVQYPLHAESGQLIKEQPIIDLIQDQCSAVSVFIPVGERRQAPGRDVAKAVRSLADEKLEPHEYKKSMEKIIESPFVPKAIVDQAVKIHASERYDEIHAEIYAEQSAGPILGHQKSDRWKDKEWLATTVKAEATVEAIKTYTQAPNRSKNMLNMPPQLAYDARMDGRTYEGVVANINRKKNVLIQDVNGVSVLHRATPELLQGLPRDSKAHVAISYDPKTLKVKVKDRTQEQSNSLGR